MLSITQEYSGFELFAELVKCLYFDGLRGLVLDLCAERDDRALERLRKSFLEGGLISLDLVMDTAEKAVTFHSFLPPILGQT